MNINPLYKLSELALIAIAVLALEFTAPPAIYAQGVMINNIQITGLVNLEQSIITEALSNLGIKPGQEITGNVLTELNKAADALYNLGFFQERPLLSLDYIEGNTILLVKVTENPLFKEIVFKGNTKFTSEELRALIKQQPGEVTNLKQIEQNILDDVLGKYATEGLVGAYIQEYALSTLEADMGTVYVTISEGMVDDVVFEGNKKTKTSLLKMIVGRQVKAGELLQKDKVEKAMQDLYNMGVFEQIEPTMEPAPTGGNIIVKFVVTETTTGQAGIGMGYSTVNGLQGTLSYSERNLLGEGKSISAQIVFSKNNPGFQVDYSDPYLSAKNFISASIYDLNYRQQRNPGTAVESELEVDSVGGDFSIGHHVNDELSVNAGVSITDYDYDVLKGDPFKDYDPVRRQRLMQTGETRSLTFGVTHDTRDNIFNSHEGGYLGASGQFAGFGGDFDFRKYTLDGRVFIPVDRDADGEPKSTVALRAKLGLGDGDEPIFEEFELGGVNSLRGVQEDTLTGTKMLLLNGEYRFPIDKKKTFTGAIFMDWGMAGESFSDTDSILCAGLGIRFRVPALGLGSIRLDLGWDLDEGGSRLNFGIGEMF